MSNVAESLEKLTAVRGFVGACLVDSSDGIVLAAQGGSEAFNLSQAAAGNAAVVRAKLANIAALSLDDEIEDILITLRRQYHLIRPVMAKPDLFLYLVVDRSKANLASGRHDLSQVEKALRL